MLQRILSNLLLKTALAAIAAAFLVQAALLWPESVQRKRSAERQAIAALVGSARADAEVKAEALVRNDISSVRTRLPLWMTDRFPSRVALIDAAGEVKAASGETPNFAEGDAADLLKDSFEDGMVKDHLDGSLIVIVPLGPQGELQEGQEPLGAFVVMAEAEEATRTLTQRGSFGDRFMMLVGGLIAAGLILLVNYLLFIKPIRQIEKYDRSLDIDSGRFATLSDERLGKDELGGIGRARNRLLERLRESQTLLRESNALLERAESKYRSLVQTVPDVVFRMDLAGQFLFLSPSLERLTGIKPESAYDNPEALFDRIVPEDRQAFQDALAGLARGEKNRTLHFRMLSPRASEAPLAFSLYYSPVLDSQGRLQAVEGLFRRAQAHEMPSTPQEPSSRLAVLHEVSGVLHSGPLRDDIFDYLAAKAAEVAGAEKAVVALLGERECQALGIYNIPEEMRLTPYSLTDTAEARVVETREPVALLNEDAWSAYGMNGSYVAVPVLDQLGQPVGLICCHGLRPEHDADGVLALSLLSDLILPAVESEKALRHAQQVEEPRPRRKKKDEDLTFFE